MYARCPNAMTGSPGLRWRLDDEPRGTSGQLRGKTLAYHERSRLALSEASAASHVLGLVQKKAEPL